MRLSRVFPAGMKIGTGSPPRRLRDFRTILIILSLLTLVQGLWITSAELIRPGISNEASVIPSGAFHRDLAALAAAIGLVRGQLWAEDALIQSGFDASSEASAPSTIPGSADIAAARAAANRALALAPIDPTMWLLLAASAPASQASAGAPGSETFEETSALEMAYLTGQENPRLLPTRLMIAVRSNALSDKGIQDFVRTDIDYVFMKAPSLKPALLAAYKASTAENRPFLAQTIKTNDPSFLSTER